MIARLEPAGLIIITHRKNKHIFQFFQENEIRFLNILLVVFQINNVGIF